MKYLKENNNQLPSGVEYANRSEFLGFMNYETESSSITDREIEKIKNIFSNIINNITSPYYFNISKIEESGFFKSSKKIDKIYYVSITSSNRKIFNIHKNSDDYYYVDCFKDNNLLDEYQTEKFKCDQLSSLLKLLKILYFQISNLLTIPVKNILNIDIIPYYENSQKKSNLTTEEYLTIKKSLRILLKCDVPKHRNILSYYGLKIRKEKNKYFIMIGTKPLCYITYSLESLIFLLNYTNCFQY